MSEQKKKHVELAKLRLGMDNQGRVHVGEVDEEGKLKPDKMKDVSGDFQHFMQIQLNLYISRLVGEINKVEKKPKIEVVTDSQQIKKIEKSDKEE